MKILIIHRLKRIRKDAACLIKMGVFPLMAYPLLYYPARTVQFPCPLPLLCRRAVSVAPLALFYLLLLVVLKVIGGKRALQ